MNKELLQTQSPFLLNELDGLEIPRNIVIINHRIGEGAFGIVYKGEMNSLSVAVKILKQGSSTENKCDFLSEIEVMRKFDHPNVVKLLGVCIKTEPLLTIMEFMVHGDLRSYLIARRDLVRELDYVTSDEIGHRRLTAMALDVARALSYLDHLRYVHR